MFEKVVSPILLYASEVWGFSCTEMLEIFHRNLLTKLLHLRPSTLLDNCGLSYMWENQCTLDNSTCKNTILDV